MSTLYAPGQRVPTSGIYRVVHDQYHSTSHEVTCVRGEPFPPCRYCGNSVRYQLAHAALHLSETANLRH